MSTLARKAEEYVTVRRAMGFKFDQPARLLSSFVGFLEAAGASTVTTELALAWATQPKGVHPNWWAERLDAVRGFARHLSALDPATEVPSADWLPRVSQRAVPYLYSPGEIASLMEAASALRPPLRAATYTTLVGLLAATGMRVGETIGLDRGDLDSAEGVLTVRGAKFGKARQVPLHESTLEALRAYAKVRDRLCYSPAASSVFISAAGARLTYQTVRRTFSGLVASAGIEPRSSRCRPRIHDLRHTFAVGTLRAFYEDGHDVEARLATLSTYLGHVNPCSTYWYLSATPELLCAAARRLETTEVQS